jgi:hypothetical protein
MQSNGRRSPLRVQVVRPARVDFTAGYLFSAAQRGYRQLRSAQHLSTPTHRKHIYIRLALKTFKIETIRNIEYIYIYMYWIFRVEPKTC